MYIEPAEYLDLTDRLSVLHKKYDEICNQKTAIANKYIGLQQKVRMLESRIAQYQLEKQKQKTGLKQHVNTKTEAIMQLIQSTKEGQKAVIEKQVGKLRNWSAINTLQKLEERIMENRTITFQKDFYQKVKTLHLIEKKTLGCTSTELFEWVRDLTFFKKNATDNQAVSIMGTTQKSLKKSMNKGTKPKRQSKFGKQKQNIPVAEQQLKTEQRPSNISKQSQNQPTINEIPTITISRPSAGQPIVKSKKQVDFDDPLGDLLANGI